MTRDERIARATAKAVADEQDRAGRRGALAEQRAALNEALRASVGPGERKTVLDPTQATPEQRKALDQGSREPIAPTMTRAEANAQMNEALRGARRQEVDES